jgi:hypothetical protein
LAGNWRILSGRRHQLREQVAMLAAPPAVYLSSASSGLSSAASPGPSGMNPTRDPPHRRAGPAPPRSRGPLVPDPCQGELNCVDRAADSLRGVPSH